LLAGELAVGEVLVVVEDEEGIALRRRVGDGLGVLNVGLGEVGGGELGKGLLSRGAEAGRGQQEEQAGDGRWAHGRSGGCEEDITAGRTRKGGDEGFDQGCCGESRRGLSTAGMIRGW